MSLYQIAYLQLVNPPGDISYSGQYLHASLNSAFINAILVYILDGLKQAVDEVNLIKQGKLKGISAKELFDEL